MPLKKMSYNTANKIFNLYSDRLINLERLGRFRKYGYSDLNGYDIIDISNAMKLLTANRVYNTYLLDDKKNAELKNYAREDDSGLTCFFLHFFPDDIISKLRRIDSDDENGLIQYNRLTSNATNSEWYQLLNKEETVESFLNYCIQIGRSDSNFWGKVYDRIGVSWESNDIKDPIYILIKYGINYQANDKQSEIELTLNGENKPLEKSKNVFDLIKKKFFK